MPEMISLLSLISGGAPKIVFPTKFYRIGDLGCLGPERIRILNMTGWSRTQQTDVSIWTLATIDSAYS